MACLDSVYFLDEFGKVSQPDALRNALKHVYTGLVALGLVGGHREVYFDM